MKRLLVVCVLALVSSGCANYSRHPIDSGPSDVAFIDKYVYKYGDPQAYRMKMTDKREISSVVRRLFCAQYTDCQYCLDRKNWVGTETTGYWLHFHSGETREFTKIWFGDRTVFVVSGQLIRVAKGGSPDAVADALPVDIALAPKVLP